MWCRGMSPITTRLYNLGGTLKRTGSPIAIKHIAELLAGEP